MGVRQYGGAISEGGETSARRVAESAGRAWRGCGISDQARGAAAAAPPKAGRMRDEHGPLVRKEGEGRGRRKYGDIAA